MIVFSDGLDQDEHRGVRKKVHSEVEQEFAALRENRSAAERVARAAVRRMAKGDPEPTEANSFGTRHL